MLVLILLTVSALLFVYWKLKGCYKLFEELGIPGPSPIPVFGNVAEFKDKSPLDVFKKWAGIYGNVYGYYEGFNPSMVVSDPDVIRHILVKDFDKFEDRPLCTPFVFYPMHLSLGVTKGELWKQQRHVVASGFSTLSIKQMLPNMLIKSESLIEKLECKIREEPDSHNVTEIIERYMLDSLAFGAFNYNSDSLNNDDEILLEYVQQYNYSASTENPCSGLARLFPSLTPFCQLFTGKLRNALDKHVKQVMTFLEKEKRVVSRSHEGSKHGNLIQSLLTTKATCHDENSNIYKRYLSDEEILAQVTSMVGGGIGPASALMSFLVYNLAIHQDVQKKVMEEINLNITDNEDVTYDTLYKLNYLDMVINETFRVFPVAPGVARTCVEDTVINGTQFKAGTVIKIMACVMYADDSIFPEAEKFIPERFSRSECEKRHPFTWLPFGDGPRNCVGKRLGLMQCKLAVVQILRKYQILQTNQTEVPLQTVLNPVLSPKNGIHVRLVPRENSGFC
ncbi:cytochrome P450 3A18 [Patella vulgata]|uniref:cytochrome P450 3A18 n=1 Tax=Patella vulgata TaxID=6465 RepID=UPI00217F6B30|nr:cytochrome P450 3A18 [Patella vulgata]